jgi:hypothetical protein
MKIHVYPTPDVKQYLNDLITILYEQSYFYFEDTAKKYVDELLDDIITNLPGKLKRPASKYFIDKFGKGLYYAVFPKSKRTHRYIFFRIYKKNGELYYQVRYIANNHTAAQHL